MVVPSEARDLLTFRDGCGSVDDGELGPIAGHTRRYRITRLVYYEQVDSPLGAVVREKQIKSWTRETRVALIESINPGWLDFAADWFAQGEARGKAK